MPSSGLGPGKPGLKFNGCTLRDVTFLDVKAIYLQFVGVLNVIP
jgi:hypothetical protein